MPDFVQRGYYLDILFHCASCQKQEAWRATQRWYEVAKGNVESRAKLCRLCRRVEQERKAEARRVHLGIGIFDGFGHAASLPMRAAIAPARLSP